MAISTNTYTPIPGNESLPTVCLFQTALERPLQGPEVFEAQVSTFTWREPLSPTTQPDPKSPVRGTIGMCWG